MSKDSHSIEFVSVVLKFQEVFLLDFPSITPDEDLYFCIDLELGTHKISIPLH